MFLIIKKLLIAFLFSLTISYSNNLIALEKQYGGPTTIEQAKERFFKNRKLDIIEGIWFNEFSDSYRAIVKESDGVYSQWAITYKGKADGEGAKNNIVRSASDKVYIYHTTVTSPKTTIKKEISGIMTLSGNLIEFSVKPFYFDDGTYSQGIPNRQQIRVWPSKIGRAHV